VWAADDPQLGNWKLDVAKSKYVTATPPRGTDVVVTPYGKDGVNVSVNTVNAKGEKVMFQYSAQYDGKPYPRIESGPGAVAGQMVTLRRVDARTVERIAFLAGKPVGTETWAISADGKTRTVKQSGIDAAGKPIDNTLIYVRQ
jgi:hypothetical protein